MLKIGDFSRLSQVSVKTLRYYDEVALLKPTQVDEVSGYRYYSVAQLRQLHRILALRDLGFSLDQIGYVLEADLSIEEMQELGKTLPPLWGEVYGWLASKGVKPAGAPLWRYLVIDMAATLEIDVGVPVATPLTGDNRIIADTLLAGRYATLIYTGPYEGLMQATADLLAWADKKGIVWDKWAAGSEGEGWRARIENYLTDPKAEPDSTKWQTELAFKLSDDQRVG